MRSTTTAGEEGIRRGLVGLALLLAAGCGRSAVESPGGGQPPPSQAKLQRGVELERAAKQSLTYYVETVGVLEAEAQTDIAPGVSGVVDALHFREGQWVERGTLLVELDRDRYDAMVAQAQANLEKAEASFKRGGAAVEKAAANRKKADGDRKAATASITEAQEMLDLRKVLLDNLLRSGRAAEEERKQEARANQRVAVARLEAAKSGLELADAAIKVAEAEQAAADADLSAASKEVVAAAALLKLAKHNRDRSQVRAPYAGQVNQRKVTLGTYVEDKMTIATIADLRRIRLVGWVPEKAAPTARELLQREELRRACRLTSAVLSGTAPLVPLTALVVSDRIASPDDFNLEFTLNAYPKQTFRARIFYMSTVASPETHMFECKAEVDMRSLDVELRPGLSARIRCPLRGNPNACVVPEESVRATERGFIAFVPGKRKTKDGREEWVAQARELKLGYRSAGFVEVQQGIAPGEWIVRKGAEALEEGTPIRFPEEQMNAMSPSPSS